MLSMRKSSRKRIPKKKSKMPILRRKNTIQTKISSNQNKSNMKFEVELTVEEPLLYEAIKQEVTDQKRTKTEVTKDNKTTTITIQAQDTTALKAHVNSVIKMIETWEKMKGI